MAHLVQGKSTRLMQEVQISPRVRLNFKKHDGRFWQRPLIKEVCVSTCIPYPKILVTWSSISSVRVLLVTSCRERDLRSSSSGIVNVNPYF